MRINASRIFWRTPAFIAIATVFFSNININEAEAAAPVKPSTPTALSITHDSGSYTVSWGSESNTSITYELRWQNLDGGHWRWLSHGTLIDGGDTQSWVLQRAITDEVLRFSIRAVNGKSKSRWSDWVIAVYVQPNNPPLANAGSNQSIVVGRKVTLDGTASTDPDGDTLTYSWQLSVRPINSQARITSPTSATPELIPDLPGEYQVELIVDDGSTSSVPDHVAVQALANNIPVADAGSDQTVSPGQVVILDGSQSFDQDGDPLGYQWSLIKKPVNSLAVMTDQSSASSMFTADVSGRYVAQLIVSDGITESLPARVGITATALNLIVLSPQNNSVTSKSFLTISGTVEGADPNKKNIGIVINRTLAVIDYSTSPMQFLARVPLINGEQTITVMATSQAGDVASETLIVTRNAGSPYDVTIEPASGTSPLDVNLKLAIDDPYNNVFVSLLVDFNDDGYDDFTYDGIEYTQEGNIIVHPMNPAQPIAYTYTEPGIYQARVKVLDFMSLNNRGLALTEHTVPVEVIDNNVNLSLFSSIWNDMNAAVLAGNINEAGNAFTRSAKKKFVPLLSALQPHYQEIMDSYNEWNAVTNFPGYKEFILTRVDKNGQSRVYFITFIQDHSGVWRITSM